MLLSDPFFIDKSQFIAQLENSSTNIEMILNPDGMLTESNIEMLKQFYRHPSKRWDFQALAVGASNAMNHQGAHYVVSLDFSSFNASSWEEAQTYFATCISAVYKAFRDIIEPEIRLSKFDCVEFRKVENEEAEFTLLKYSLKYLLQYIEKSTKSKPVLLINGVDVPYEVAGMYDYIDVLNSFFTTFYVSWAKDGSHSNYLHRALLFGRSRVMEGGTFTGLNNIGLFSLFSSGHYNDSFAFTEGEVSTLFERHGLPATLMSDIKQVAGGYTYNARGGDMLMNPQQVVRYIQSRLSQTMPPVTKDPKVQWYLARAFETGSMTMDTFVRLLEQREDNYVTFSVCSNIDYDEFDNEKTILSYLAYQGLLACIPSRSTSQRRSMNRVPLIIPNRAAYDAIKHDIFGNASFNKAHLPCPLFYPLAFSLAEIIPSVPNPSKPVQLRQIAMNANYKEIIRDNLAHVPREAFFHAMIAEPGKIKCFFAPGASFKSSLISMIECCFNAGRRPDETREMWSDETYPVLIFRFSTLNDNIKPWLKSQLQQIKRCHPSVMFDKACIDALLLGEESEKIMTYLIDVLYQHYQKPVVVLIDSATKPFFNDALADDSKTKAFVKAFCSALVNNPQLKVAGLFGVNEGAHCLFDPAVEVKSYSTMRPNAFRKYFALSEGEAKTLIRQAYQVNNVDLEQMLYKLKNACTLFTENDVAYLHTWYACLHIKELKHATRLSDEPQHLTQRYQDFSKEACGMIRRLYQQSNYDPEVLKAFKVIFGDPAEAAFSLFANPTEEPDYRLQNVKSIVCQMISGGVLTAVPTSGRGDYWILPANALFKTIFLGSFNRLLKECRQEHSEAYIANPSALFQPAVEVASAQVETTKQLRK